MVSAQVQSSAREAAADGHAPAPQRGALMALSSRPTPEPLPTQHPLPPTTLANGESAAYGHLVSTGVSQTTPPPGLEAVRKPIDRHDMRQIKTELPPAFIPSAGQHTPHSASSSQRHPNSMQYGYPANPSTSSIVFGGHDSSGSSPAPPPGAASAFGPPPPSLQGSYYAHAHHTSDPLAPRHVPPGPVPNQPPLPWQTRQGFPSTHHYANGPFRYPPRENFVPAASVLANGRSRSGSHASSVAPEGQRSATDLQSPGGFDHVASSGRASFHDARPSVSGPIRHGPSHFQNPLPPPSYPHPEMAAGFENAESMRDHIFSQFQKPEMSDCYLEVSEEFTSGKQVLDGHKLVLARSTRLLEILRNTERPTAPSNSQMHVLVELKGRYVRTGPFIDCIRYLYGGPLPPFHLSNSGPNASSEERVELALQCIATGAWLNIHAIAQRGVEIAASLLHWDTMSTVLSFALEGGLGQIWPIDDGSEERTSTCSSDDSFSRPEAGGSPMYDPHSSALLGRALEYTAHNLPVNFYLNSAAPQSLICQRLSERPHHQSNSSRSDPRLSKIRFGDMSSEDPSRPSPTTTTISSVLLSLPFPLLKYLLEHPVLTHRLGADTVSSIMRQVVQERETRRQKSLKAHTAARLGNSVDGQNVQNLYWEESVEASHHHRAGFRLARRRRGIDTPPSSGTE